MRVPLIGSSSQGVSVNLDSQRTINLMEDLADSKNAKAPNMLISTPGLSFVYDSTGAAMAPVGGQLRGLFSISRSPGTDQNACLVLAGGTLYRIDNDAAAAIRAEAQKWSLTQVGTNIGRAELTTTPAIFAEGRSQVLVVPQSGNSAYVYDETAGTTGSEILFDASTIIPVNDGTCLAGYFLVLLNTPTASLQHIHYSALNDATTWSSLDFFTAEADSSLPQRIRAKTGYLWVFKDNSITHFVPSGDPNNPFTPITSSIIPYGCAERNSVEQVGDNFYWIGHGSGHSGFAVYRSVGFAAEKISNNFVDNFLQQTARNFQYLGTFDVVASSCMERGHLLYKLSFHRAKRTLVFDVLTGKWHERNWYNQATGEFEEDLAWLYTSFQNIHLVADRRTDLITGGQSIGGLYELNETVYSNTVWHGSDTTVSDAGVDGIIHRQRIGPHLSGPNRERISINWIELEFEMGLGNTNNPSADPQVVLELSWDAGHTFGRPRVRSLGPAGKTRTRCQFSACGSGYDAVPRITMTDSTPWRLISAYADISKGA